MKFELHAAMIETGDGDSRKVKSVVSQEDQIEEYKAEIEKQEQLIAGYQRENQKLFQDLSVSKVSISTLLL